MSLGPSIILLIAALTPGWGFILDPPWALLWIPIYILWWKAFD